MFRVLIPRPCTLQPLNALGRTPAIVRSVASVSSHPRIKVSPSPFDADFDDDSNGSFKPIEEIIPQASSSTPPAPISSSQKGADREPIDKSWRAHREAMKRKFPDGWDPPKRLSRDNMDRLRAMHRSDPDKFATPVLADEFRISVEAVRRILKSRFEPTAERAEELADKEMRRKEEKLAVYKEMRQRREKWKEGQRQLRRQSDLQRRPSSPRLAHGARRSAPAKDGFMLQ